MTSTTQETKRGWWSLNIEGLDRSELSEATLEDIAKMIKDGCTSGEVIEEGAQ